MHKAGGYPGLLHENLGSYFHGWDPTIGAFVPLPHLSSLYPDYVEFASSQSSGNGQQQQAAAGGNERREEEAE